MIICTQQDAGSTVCVKTNRIEGRRVKRRPGSADVVKGGTESVRGYPVPYDTVAALDAKCDLFQAMKGYCGLFLENRACSGMNDKPGRRD